MTSAREAGRRMTFRSFAILLVAGLCTAAFATLAFCRPTTVPRGQERHSPAPLDPEPRSGDPGDARSEWVETKVLRSNLDTLPSEPALGATKVAVEVSGTVVDSDGHELPDAGVTVTVFADQIEAGWLSATDVTGADGRYRCSLGLPATVEHSDAQIRIVVVVSRAGYQPNDKSVTSRGTGPQQIDLTLHPGIAVVGRVLHRGAAVAGAFAKAVARSKDGSARTAWARTLADGKFAIGLHESVRVERVTAFHGEWGVADRPCFDHAGGGDFGDLELLPMTPLGAQILHLDGQPLSGFQVTLLRTEGNDLDESSGGCFWDPITDASGGFVLYGMRSGSFRVYVHGTEVSGFSAPIGVVETGAPTKVLPLPGARVRVRTVRDGVECGPDECWVRWHRKSEESWVRDVSADLDRDRDRVVDSGSVWRLELVRHRDSAVVDSRVLETGSRSAVEVEMVLPGH